MKPWGYQDPGFGLGSIPLSTLGAGTATPWVLALGKFGFSWSCASFLLHSAFNKVRVPIRAVWEVLCAVPSLAFPGLVSFQLFLKGLPLFQPPHSLNISWV